MSIVRVSCPGHWRHWFATHGHVGGIEPWCVRCGAPNPRCPDCGAATHAKALAMPESTTHVMCANGHHHHADERVQARQVKAVLYRRDRVSS